MKYKRMQNIPDKEIKATETLRKKHLYSRSSADNGNAVGILNDSDHRKKTRQLLSDKTN